ncbi:MAG: hypothetical protein ACKOOC_08475, partial [Cyanobium sp.]
MAGGSDTQARGPWKGRHFLSSADLDSQQTEALLDLAADLKAGRRSCQLAGRTLGLIFTKAFSLKAPVEHRPRRQARRAGIRARAVPTSRPGPLQRRAAIHTQSPRSRVPSTSKTATTGSEGARGRKTSGGWATPSLCNTKALH